MEDPYGQVRIYHNKKVLAQSVIQFVEFLCISIFSEVEHWLPNP